MVLVLKTASQGQGVSSGLVLCEGCEQGSVPGALGFSWLLVIPSGPYFVDTHPVSTCLITWHPWVSVCVSNLLLLYHLHSGLGPILMISP